LAEELNLTEEVAEAAPETGAPATVYAQNSTDLAPDLTELESNEPRKEVVNGRSYEITYIGVANNPEATENTQNKLRALVEAADGVVDNIRVSEVRRLAYPINKVTDGVYVVVNARFVKKLVEELDRFFKLEESVLRHIVLRQDA
jgi:small subunit ribosomal protein S6